MQHYYRVEFFTEDGEIIEVEEFVTKEEGEIIDVCDKYIEEYLNDDDWVDYDYTLVDVLG